MVRAHFNQTYDKDGILAEEGRCIPNLLNTLLQDPFFQNPPPKSIGKEYFSLNWLKPRLLSEYKAMDVLATLLVLTATLVIEHIKQMTYPLKKMVLCGGGVHNQTLFHFLQRNMDLEIISSEQLGINPDFLEAMMFAWLADKRIKNEPLDFTQITGSQKKAIYGAIFPPGLDK